MDSALDSPLEALAFNYLTYGFLTAVNNMWAWIAVFTAALSFWRMRAFTMETSRDAVSTTSTAPPRLAESAAEEPARASCHVLERQGSTKMKFSLYYKEEVDKEEEDSPREDDGGENEECGGGAVVRRRELDAWRGEWEEVVAMRMGDMGWYRWQDRTVLDGSVVRLWDGRRRRHAAAQVMAGGAAW